MNDLDQLLHDAGARLRDTAPSAEATAAALAGLDDVRLDETSTGHRRRAWVIAPAILAAAALTLGVLVVTRPADDAISPADTTAVPTPTTLAPEPTTVPATVPAPVTAPVTAPSTVAPTTTPTTAPGEVELLANTRLRTTDVNFDGDGGACLTVVKATGEEVARGCAPGPTMRSASGQGVRFRVDEVPVVLFPTGRDGTGQPELVLSPPSSRCVDALDQPTRMVDEAGCTSDGFGVVGTLPLTPDADTTWVVAGPGTSGTPAELLAAAEPSGVRVFRTGELGDAPRCLQVAAPGNVLREGCGADGTSSLLAGSPDAPIIVDYDDAAGTAVVTAVDPATGLAASGCPDLTTGQLHGLLPATATVSALLCGAETAVAVRPASVQLDPTSESIPTWDVLTGGAGGWSVVQSGFELQCTEVPDVCRALNVADLGEVMPFPTPATIAAFDAAIADGAALTSRNAVEDFGDLPTARNLPQLADGLAAILRAGADPDQRIEVVGTSDPIVIRQTNLDDSMTATIYVVGTGTGPDGVVVVVAVRAFDVCGRGVTTLDGRPACI